jgi:hypothetical protein
MRLMNNRINHQVNRSIVRNMAIALASVLTIMLMSAGFGSNRVGASIIAASANSPTLDIVATNFVENSTGPISFLAGGGNGSFSSPTFSATAGVGAVAIDSGDFDKDGYRDIVVANFYGSSVTVFYGNGAGGFTPGTNFGVSQFPVFVAAADLNGDGNMDIVVDCNGFPGNVAVLLSNGSRRTFQPATFYNNGNDSLYLAVGDVNGDCKPDIAVTARQDFHGLRILTNNGNGTFTVSTAAAFDAPNTANPIGVAIADFNLDGNSDIAVVNSGINPDHTDFFVTTAIGTSFGSLSDSPGFFSTGFTDTVKPVRPYGLAVGFFNDDTFRDLVVVSGDKPPLNDGNGLVKVLLNDGSGGFISQTGRELGCGIRVPHVADLNNDSLDDVAIGGSDGNVYVLLADRLRGLATPIIYSAVLNPAAITTGEFDGLDAGLDQITSGLGEVGSLLPDEPLDYFDQTPIVTGNVKFRDTLNSIHTAVWSWGDDTTSAGIVDEKSGTITGSHTYTAPGVYTITLTVTNACGNSGTSTFQYVVIYDSKGGFVTGSGWINSPPGAYTADPGLTGKANFGFVSKYLPGANVPTGNTEFQFKAGNLNFQSSSYEWLVILISGAKVQFKGVGTINGSGRYGFILTAIDGQLPSGGDTDKFRIKIWDENRGNAVIYDNMMNHADNDDPTTTLGGGNIIIHKQD